MKATMKRKYRKGIRITLLSFLATIAMIAGVILFPQKLFANKMKYKEFTVCSNSEIDDNIKTVLDGAISLVKESELYDPTYQYNIILCYNTFYNKFDDKIFGAGPAGRSRLHNVIVKIRIDPEKNLAFPVFPKACEIKLTYLIAHEMIHCLQANRYGIKKFNPYHHPEYWKLEGYPEYISRKPELSNNDYSLQREIKRYADLEGQAETFWISQEKDGCEAPNYYYKGRLMMEYLIGIKHLSYDKILNDTVPENTIYREMLKWKDGAKENGSH
jgi:hypothetical protein